MPERQCAWSEYEAAILLEAYLDAVNSGEPRRKYIERASRVLRRMAVNCGMDIDDAFRNYNGIQFQMKSLESAFTGLNTLKPATKLFTNIAVMYKSNRASMKKY